MRPNLKSRQPATGAEPRRLTGWMVLAMLVSFFLVVASVNGYMIRAAIGTFPGTEVKNSYVASQQYNREIVAMRQQAERSWKVDVSLRRQGPAALLDLTIRDASGQPVRGLALTARLAHPVDAKIDHSGDVEERAGGVYAVNFGEVQRGAWNLVIEARRDGERLYASRNRVELAQ
jgi:nitrogen fixation protein FixH